MKLHLNLFLSLFLLSFISYSQTVFITAPSSGTKDFKSDIVFSQISLSLPFSVNPDSGQADQYSQTNDSWLIPDGLSAHASVGLHLKKWIGLSINTGLDWRAKQKLVAAPVYAMLTLNPHFNKEVSIVLQGGIGQSFALGRGNLSGTYKKYRVGIMFNDVLLFADSSLFGFPYDNFAQAGSFTLGISLLNFE